MPNKGILYFVSIFSILMNTVEITSQSIIYDFQVNETDATGGLDNWKSSIAVDQWGNFMIVWTDNRDDDNGDIYAQCYTHEGISQGINFKVNDDEVGATQRTPSIASDAHGNVVVVWQDYRNGASDIYAQCYLIDGSPTGNNFRVNDDGSEGHQSYSSVDMDENGNFVIVWRDNRSGYYDIYAQRYGRGGSPIGGNIEVYHSPTEEARQPSIGVAGGGDFVIAFTAHIGCHGHIYAQRYFWDGRRSGNLFKVNEGEPDSKRFKDHPSVAADGAGNFIVVWQDRRNLPDSPDIYAQRYSSDGSLSGINIRVNDDPNDIGQMYPSIDFGMNGNYIVAWVDYSWQAEGIVHIRAQRYTDIGTSVGHNFYISPTGPKNRYHPDVKLQDGKIYTTWKVYNKERSGYDIWANVLDWKNPIPQKKLGTLRQGYPNPFYKSGNVSGYHIGFTIEYELFSSVNVQLSVYNLLGKRIRLLICDYQSAGHYRIVWDGKDEADRTMASGIYIITLEADGVYYGSNKIMLVN